MRDPIQENDRARTENQRIIDSYDYLGKAVSSTDCTGLIPAGLRNRAEQESYEALYSYRPPHISENSKSDHK